MRFGSLVFFRQETATEGGLHAEDITTRDGRVFKNASMVKLEADGVVIKHDGGTK